MQVRIIDDNDWLVDEESDTDDSACDSEDSNAEGFHAHDYPDTDFGSDSDERLSNNSEVSLQQIVKSHTQSISSTSSAGRTCTLIALSA